METQKLKDSIYLGGFLVKCQLFENQLADLNRYLSNETSFERPTAIMGIPLMSINYQITN